MQVFVMLLLIVGIVLVVISWLRADLKCPAPTVIYRYVPTNTLDIQFGNDNNPSQIYADMFNQSSPWIGGTTIGDGKTVTLISTSGNTITAGSLSTLQTAAPLTTPLTSLTPAKI